MKNTCEHVIFKTELHQSQKLLAPCSRREILCRVVSGFLSCLGYLTWVCPLGPTFEAMTQIFRQCKWWQVMKCGEKPFWNVQPCFMGFKLPWEGTVEDLLAMLSWNKMLPLGHGEIDKFEERNWWANETHAEYRWFIPSPFLGKDRLRRHASNGQTDSNLIFKYF